MLRHGRAETEPSELPTQSRLAVLQRDLAEEEQKIQQDDQTERIREEELDI